MEEQGTTIVYHEHELRICEDEFGELIEGGEGQTVMKVTLPEGETILKSPSFRIRGQQPEGAVNGWKRPEVGLKLPQGLPAVEWLVDGKIVARGHWPDRMIPIEDDAA